jgi:uncharacterized protein YpmB
VEKMDEGKIIYYLVVLVLIFPAMIAVITLYFSSILKPLEKISKEIGDKEKRKG